MTTASPDPDRLYRLLVEHGFTLAGRSRGSTRLVWPGGDERWDTVSVPNAGQYPDEFAENMNGVLDDLRRRAAWGKAAESVLAAVDDLIPVHLSDGTAWFPGSDGEPVELGDVDSEGRPSPAEEMFGADALRSLNGGGTR
jgi:hypothetical protein